MPIIPDTVLIQGGSSIRFRKNYCDVAIVGAGILGLATGMKLADRFPGLEIAIFEKENGIAVHQTGNNSGVIHSGLYYRPGSLKAKLCISGSDALVSFCREYGVPFEICGKVVVATTEEELPALDELYRRGNANGIRGLKILSPAEVCDFEPHVHCIRGMHVPSTGIVDYRRVAAAYRDVLAGRGGVLHLGTRVGKIKEIGPRSLLVVTSRGEFQCRLLVNCGGLYSDRVARSAGLMPPCRIVPFRGEYYQIIPERAGLVKNLVYPVPDPKFPFLGVHFTRKIDGKVEAGPNAVLAFAREGYRRTSVCVPEFMETLCYGGFWKLVRRYWKSGMGEMRRSFSKALFTRALQQLAPEIHDRDLVAGGAGVRAQALGNDGKLLDDFVIQKTDRMVHVLNAPSPAATSSPAIAGHIADICGALLD